MDTEAIASEIVTIRNRLRELDQSPEADVDAERTQLRDRLHHLQDVLAGNGAKGTKSDSTTQSDKVQYVPPA